MKNKTTETEQLVKRSKKKSGGMQELKTNFNLSITQQGDTQPSHCSDVGQSFLKLLSFRSEQMQLSERKQEAFRKAAGNEQAGNTFIEILAKDPTCSVKGIWSL